MKQLHQAIQQPSNHLKPPSCDLINLYLLKISKSFLKRSDITANYNQTKQKNIGGSIHLEIPIIGSGVNISGEIHGNQISNITYQNSQINANNNITITTTNNTTIKGANIKATNNLSLTTKNLDISSIQNTKKSTSFQIGASKGQTNSSTNSHSGSSNQGANFHHSTQNRKWVDNQTTLIANNNITINTQENTNIQGALIANLDQEGNDQGNLTLNTKTLTYNNIQDKDKARSIGAGFTTSQNRYTNNQNQNTTSTNENYNLSYSMHDIEQTTRATIGQGDITVGGVNTNQDQSLIANLNRDTTKSQEITKQLTVSPITAQYSRSKTTNHDSNQTQTSNIFTDKFNELKQIIQNPLQPFENNLTQVANDINLISNELRRDGNTQLANTIDNTINKTKENYNIIKNQITQEIDHAKQQTIEAGKLAGEYTLNGVEKAKDFTYESIILGSNELIEAAEYTADIPVVGDVLSLVYGLTPMGAGRYIEEARGSSQTLYPGGPAVYKSGDEPNGVLDPNSNNIGMGNIPIKDGKVDYSKVGSTVRIYDLLEKGYYTVLTNEGGILSIGCNYIVVGCNDMSLTHDALATHLKVDSDSWLATVSNTVTNQGTIVPIYGVNSYALTGKPLNMIIDHIKAQKIKIKQRQRKDED